MSPSDFQTVLSKQGYNGTSMIGVMCDTYRASPDLQNNVTTELQLLQAEVHTHFLSFGSLRRLAVENTDFMDPTFMQDLDRIVNANRGLQDVNIVVQGVNLLCQLESFLNMWRDSPSRLRLTLLERTKDSRGWVVVQVAIGGSNVTAAVYSTQQAILQEQIYNSYEDLEFSQWSRDHIGTPKSDSLVSLLNTVTWLHPSALTTFFLDISLLSDVGFILVQNILYHSRLDHLYIRCTPVDYRQWEHIVRPLQSVHWSSLTSLVLFGVTLDSWILLLTETNTPFATTTSSDAHRLLRFGLFGTRPVPQNLSHSSVLSLHRLICSSALLDLQLENIDMKDRRNWSLIAEVVGYIHLESLGVSMNDICLPTSAKDEWGLL